MERIDVTQPFWIFVQEVLDCARSGTDVENVRVHSRAFDALVEALDQARPLAIDRASLGPHWDPTAASSPCPDLLTFESIDHIVHALPIYMDDDDPRKEGLRRFGECIYRELDVEDLVESLERI